MVGRPQIIDDIEETLEVSVPQIHVDWRKNNKDIVDYLRASIKKSKVLRAAKKDLQDEVVKTLSEKSNGMFMWVDLMMQELSKKSRPGSIRESLHRAPKGLEKMLQHVLKGYSSMLKEDDSEDLNIMLMWVTCAARPLCLAELDVVLKLQSPEGDEVLFLEGKLRRQFASFFVLRREDHLSTADLQGDVPKTELASDDVGVEDLDNVENETYFESNPHTTTVAFCHASIGDFFREVNNGKVSAGPEEPAIGVNIVEAKVGVLKECLSFICNYHEMVKKIPDCRNLGDYVNCSWYTHLKEAAEILDKVSTTHRQEIGTLLVKMLREEAIMMTWARVRRCAFFTSDTLKALKIWLECPELLEVLGSEDRLWIERIQANQSEIFRPCAKFYASKWLRSSYWPAHQCMLVVHNISNLLLDRTDKKITDSSQNVSVQLISEAAEWAQFERTALWHRRLAICFRGNGHYDEGLRHFEKALELDETMWVAKNGVARTLAARGEYEKAIELGKAVDTILEKLLSEARESNHADSKHVSAAARVSINSLMADWYRKLLDYKSAMKHFKKAMEIDSQRYDIIHDYICILGVQGEFEEIVSSLKLIDENSENQKYTNLIIMLSKYVWWDDCFFEFVLGASRETQQLQWLQDIYEKAVVATKKRQLPVEATVLEVCLSIIYKWLGVQGDKLEHLFENVLKFVVRPGALENSSIQRCQEFIAREYGRYCLEKAYSAVDDSKVARYVGTLERLSKIKSKATDDNKEVLTTRLSAVYLGIWHHLHGRELEAREYLKPSLKQALMLLSDADPSNDIEGYWMVAMVLVAAGEDESARAVLHAIRPTEKVERYAEMSELKPLKRAKEERRKNKKKNESEGDDKAPSSEVNRNGRENDPFSITTSLTSSSEEAPLERGEDKYPGEVWYYPFTCDGPCDRDFPLYIKVNMCHICLRDICDDCLKLIHDGHESARLTCSKDHKWLHVDPPSKEVEEGEILVGDKVVKLEEFVQELRKKWAL
jgi:tetratricopeptide (TPR) repeat protein